MKALLMESNAARSRSEEIQKKEIPAQEKEIKKIEEKIKERLPGKCLQCLVFLTALLCYYIISYPSFLCNSYIIS